VVGGSRGADVTGRAGKDKEREERLAAALRQNLRRRKEQVRALTKAPAKDKEDGD